MKRIATRVIALAMCACGVLAQERPETPVVPQPLEQPPQRPGLEIFAELMEADLKTKTILYSNKVVAIDQPLKPGDPATTLRCDTLLRTNDGQYDIIIAQGNVQIDQGDTHARGQRATYTSETERLEITGPFGEFPVPMLYSTQSTNANAAVLTNWGEKIIYDRRNGKLTIDKIRTFVPQSTLSRGTNAGNPFDLSPRRAQTNETSVRTNRLPFSTAPGTPPRRLQERKGGS